MSSANVVMGEDEFFSCPGDLRQEKHVMPDGKAVYVGEIGGDEWEEIQAETMRESSLRGKDRFYQARWIVRSVMNEDKTPLFRRPLLNGDAEQNKAELARYNATLQKVMKMPFRAFKPIMDIVNRINFIGDAENDKLKKKSGSESSDGSSSSAETPDVSTSTP